MNSGAIRGEFQIELMQKKKTTEHDLISRLSTENGRTAEDFLIYLYLNYTMLCN